MLASSCPTGPRSSLQAFFAVTGKPRHNKSRTYNCGHECSGHVQLFGRASEVSCFRDLHEDSHGVDMVHCLFSSIAQCAGVHQIDVTATTLRGNANKKIDDFVDPPQTRSLAGTGALRRFAFVFGKSVVTTSQSCRSVCTGIRAQQSRKSSTCRD